jgi:multidrug efflux pump subunit AcrA (membrane-fusion protein)
VAASAPAPGEETPFLAPDPPPVVARGLAWVLLLIFLTAAVLAAIVKIPDTIVARFILVPVRGADPVRAPKGGTIVQAAASEGRIYEQGAVLFAIRSDEFRNRVSEKGTYEAQLRGSAESVENLRKKNALEEQAAQDEVLSLEKRALYLQRLVALKNEQLALTKEQAERAKKLAEQGIASFDERSNTLIRHSQAVMEAEQLEADVKANDVARVRLAKQNAARRATFEEAERTELQKAEELRIKLVALDGDPSDAKGGDLPVVAPCPGTVFSEKVRGPGAIVHEGDVLCEIACSGEKLQVEIDLPQEGLARIRSGLEAKLFYDAFPYERFGVKRGIVRWASPAGISSGDKTLFAVYVQPEDQSATVDGQERPLLPGMRGTARIVVGHRSVLSFAFAPLRQLQENVK